MPHRSAAQMYRAARKSDALLTGAPLPTLFYFALPIILGNIFQQLYSIVDAIVVGKFLGDLPLAGISVAAPIVDVANALVIGGLGICGRPFCCGSFLGGFQPVSIKMAKEQGLSLNPVKISGTCGRLMCCLKYEQEAYLDLLRTTPKVNAVVSTPDGKGVVIDQNLLTGKLTVRLDKSPDAAPSVYKVKDVRVLKDGQIKLNKKEIEEFKKLEN